MVFICGKWLISTKYGKNIWATRLAKICAASSCVTHPVPIYTLDRTNCLILLIFFVYLCSFGINREISFSPIEYSNECYRKSICDSVQSFLNNKLISTVSLYIHVLDKQNNNNKKKKQKTESARNLERCPHAPFCPKTSQST